MIKSRLDESFDQDITNILRAREEKRRLEHEPSGKLSAGMLAKPLLEQVLRVLAVPGAIVTDYGLRKMQRGRDVEEWFVGLYEGPEQVKVEYRNAVGYLDKVIKKDGRLWEVKSIKNSQAQYIDPNNTKRRRSPSTGELEPVYKGVKWGDALQAGLYALALKKPEFGVIYVSAEDYRTWPHVIELSEVEDDINSIISEVDAQLKSHKLPSFEAREDWHNLPKYAEEWSRYPEWVHLDPDTAMKKLEQQFPEAYKKLMEY